MPPRLTHDTRIHVVAVLVAWGTVCHVLKFVLDQTMLGPMSDYMERWSRVLPSVGWSSTWGIALHLTTAAVAILMLLPRRRRELLAVLLGPYVLSQLATPDRISSHSAHLVAGLMVVAGLAALESLDRTRGASSADRHPDWYGWTFTGLALVCALTYWFGAFYKLNPVWCSDRSAGTRFLMAFLAPLLEPTGLATAARALLAPVAIYGTIVLELVLPLLLFGSRTRLLGCALGLAFHVPMIAQGVSDFTAMTVAFYPAFLSVSEVQELLNRLRQPTLERITVTGLVGALGCRAVVNTPAFLERRQAPDVNALVLAANTTLTCALLLVFIYAAVTVAAGLRTPRAAARVTPWRGGRSVPLGAAGVIGLVLFLVTYNNLGTFFGLPTVAPMTVFSGIDADYTNHYLMPRLPLVYDYGYVPLVRFEAPALDTREAREFQVFVRFVEKQAPPPRLHLEFLRYQMSRICRSGGAAAVRVELASPHGTIDDVCARPEMLRYVPLRLTPAVCHPGSCSTVIRTWVAGGLLASQPHK
jgi:hypothetical protein